MRTLKKTLCLVLCLAMMVGLCAIGASASEFTDDEEIANKEEVDLVVGLGIIEGYPDGSFKPEKILTRAEAAKIIAYLLLGKDAAEALPKADTQFTDVTAAHWASGFIGYCAAQGIVEGKGNDKFAPSDTLKAAEWGKMLLCAIGYDQDIEGMTGSSWDFNVTRLVTRTKLNTGIAFNGATEMSRDAACLLAYNALTVPMVTYVNGVTVKTEDGTQVDVNAQKQYRGYLADNYDLAVPVPGTGINPYTDQLSGFAAGANISGIIVENDANKATADGTTKIFSAQTGVVLATVDYATDADLLGHYVTVYRDRFGDVVSLTEIGTVKEIAKDTDAKTFKSTFGVSTGKFDAMVRANERYFIDGIVYSEAALEALDLDNDTVFDYTVDYATGVALAGTYVFDDEGYLVAVILSDADVCLDKVTKVDTKAETITLYNSNAPLVLKNDENNDQVEEYEGIAKDDIVVVTKLGTGASTVYKLEKAEKVNGAVTKAAKVGTKYTLTVDGVDYAQLKGVNKSGLSDAVPTAANIDAGKTYTLYLIGGKWVACVDDNPTVATFAVYYVLARYEKTVLGDKGKGDIKEKYAIVVNAKGEKSEILYEVMTGAVYGTPTSNQVMNVGEFWTLDATGYTSADAGYAYGIKKLGAEFTNGNYEPASGAKYYMRGFGGTYGTDSILPTAKTIAIAGGTAYVDGSTTFIFVKNMGTATTADVDVKAGISNVNYKTVAGTAINVLYTVDTQGNKIAKTVFVGGAYAAASYATGELLYFIGEKSHDSTGYTYTTYDVATGEVKEILTKKTAGVANKFFKFATDADGYTTLTPTAGKDYIVEPDAKINAPSKVIYDGSFDKYYGSSITIAGTEIDASKAKFIDVRSPLDAYEGDIDSLEALTAAAAELAADGGKKVYVSVFVDAKGAAATVFITKTGA